VHRHGIAVHCFIEERLPPSPALRFFRRVMRRRRYPGSRDRLADETRIVVETA